MCEDMCVHMCMCAHIQVCQECAPMCVRECARACEGVCVESCYCTVYLLRVTHYFLCAHCCHFLSLSNFSFCVIEVGYSKDLSK